MYRIVTVLFLVGCAATQPGPSQDWIDNNLSEEPVWVDPPPIPITLPYSQIVTPNGKVGFTIACRSMGVCYKWASALCAVGYEILSNTQDSVACAGQRTAESQSEGSSFSSASVFGGDRSIVGWGMESGQSSSSSVENASSGCVKGYNMIVECSVPDEEETIVLEEESE